MILSSIFKQFWNIDAIGIDDCWSRRRSSRDPGLVPAWRDPVHLYGGGRFIHPRRDEHGKERQSPARSSWHKRQPSDLKKLEDKNHEIYRSIHSLSNSVLYFL